MHRRSILRAVPRDLEALPIGGLEAFVLSQVGDRSRVEDVAELVGLEVEEMLRVAQRLADLGALVVDEEKPKTKRASTLSRMRAATASAPSKRGVAILVPPEVVPVPRRHAHPRMMHIGPREAFVMSQIDGATSVLDLGIITSLSTGDLSEALQALEAAGAVELPNRPRRSSAKHRAVDPEPPAADSTPKPRASLTPGPTTSLTPKPPEATPRPPARTTPKPPRGTPRPSAPPARPEPREPSGPALPDLSNAERDLITETATRIESVDHYAALGVDRDVDTRTIRRAYHALAAQFHPDRFFGKNLGAHRQPLERIFDRITKAYEALSRKTERDLHDATLGPAPPTRAPRKPSVAMRSAARKSRRMAKASASALAAAVASVGSQPRETPPAPRAARPDSSREPAARPASLAPPAARAASLAPPAARAASLAPPATRAASLAPPATRAASLAPPATRAASLAPPAARAASLAPPAPPAARAVSVPPTAPRTTPSNVPPAAREALLRMYADKQQAIRERAGVFVRAAKEALERDDLVAAANHYGLAVQCSDDPAIRAAFAETEKRARVRVHDKSVAQARAAEEAERWGEAATQYAKAYGAQAEAWIAERAANAIRKDGGELRRAAQLAEQAVLAEPQNASYRVTLAEIYCDAGLMTRAAGEAGRASALAPDDARVKALAKRFAKGKRG